MSPFHIANILHASGSRLLGIKEEDIGTLRAANKKTRLIG